MMTDKVKRVPVDAIILCRISLQSEQQLTSLSWSHSVVESAGDIVKVLFNDNTLIQFNSIITAHKWPSTAKVGSRGLKAACISSFSSSSKGSSRVYFLECLLYTVWGHEADVLMKRCSLQERHKLTNFLNLLILFIFDSI